MFDVSHWLCMDIFHSVSTKTFAEKSSHFEMQSGNAASVVPRQTKSLSGRHFSRLIVPTARPPQMDNHRSTSFTDPSHVLLQTNQRDTYL